MSFLSRSWNIGNFMVLLGLFGLGFSLVWPYVAAQRVARIENWAEDISEHLLRTTLALDEPFSVETPDFDGVLAGMTNRTYADRLTPVSSTAGANLSPGAYFEGKHYYYWITRMPDGPGATEPSPVEVYAWPRSTLSPTRSSFFFAEGEVAMFSHNLRAGYRGLERTPRAGSGWPIKGEDTAAGAYKGHDDERWIALPSAAERERRRRDRAE